MRPHVSASSAPAAASDTPDSDAEDRIEYRVDGLRHRADGPAVIYPSGTQMWYLHGRHHRVDGPAIEWFDGATAWIIHGIALRPADVERYLCLQVSDRSLVTQLIAEGATPYTALDLAEFIIARGCEHAAH